MLIFKSFYIRMIVEELDGYPIDGELVGLELMVLVEEFGIVVAKAGVLLVLVLVSN